MGTVATSVSTFGYPPQSYMDRERVGALTMLYKKSGGDWGVAQTTDYGTTWADVATLTRANVQEWSGIVIDNNGFMHWAYRTNESSQDRVYYRRLDLNQTTPVWSAEVLTGAPANGGVAGAVHQGLDLHVVISAGTSYVAVAAGTALSGATGVTLYGVTISPSGVFKYNNGIIASKRQWLTTGSGRQGPSVDIQHNGDGKTGSVPHLWVTYGRTDLRVVKCAWNGSGWTGPTNPAIIATGLGSQDAMTGRFDGTRLLMCAPDPGSTSRVRVFERDASNSNTTIRSTPTHPTGVIRSCTIAYDSSNRDLRVYAIGTSTAVLYSVHYTRATDTWGAWGQVNATAVEGATPTSWGTRRNTFGNSRWDSYTQHAGAPNTLTHNQQGVTYAPNTPTWNVAGIGFNNGAAADVTVDLVLDWDFTDADPSDAQTAFALSRQIGVATIAYFRASDSTWQATEQKNLTGTTSRTLPGFTWGGGTDLPHTYKVKVWDGADLPSVYSDPFVVVASTTVNPTITAPTGGGTVTTNQVTVTWTVAEQTSFRVVLKILSQVMHDSGWVDSAALSYAVPWELVDGFSYTAELTTRNNEGLASATQTVNFNVDFIEPPAPSIVATPITSQGIIEVAITNPSPVGGQPAFVAQDLWRRPLANPILNANTDFETDLTGWGSGVGGVASRASDFAKFGTWSLKLVPDGVTATVYVELNPKLTATAGVSYHADGWIRAATVNKPVAILIRWYTGAGAFISETSFPAIPIAASAFLYSGPIGIAPPTTGQMTIGIRVSSTPAVGDIIWGDGLRVRATDGSEGLKVASNLLTGATFDDWTARAAQPYEYRAIAQGANGTSRPGPWTP